MHRIAPLRSKKGIPCLKCVEDKRMKSLYHKGEILITHEGGGSLTFPINPK